MSDRVLPDDPALVRKWDALLPARKYLPDGSESMYSRVQRAGTAKRLEDEAEKTDPRLASENATRRTELARQATIDANEAEDTRFWNATPHALRRMGLGEAHIALIPDLQPDWPGVVAVDAWRASKKLFLVLGGPPGTGKTLATVRVLLDEGKEHVVAQSYEADQWRPAWAKFVRAADLARLSYYDKADLQRMQGLENARWLIIDDLGAESMSDPWRASLLELVDKRMAAGRRTCITTNLSGDAFKERYDARVMRRLKEHGSFVAVQPRGNS